MDNQTQWSYMKKEDQEKLRQKQRRILDIQPLPQRVTPLPWEDLGSFLSRAARRMEYEKPEWLLRIQGVPHKMNPDNLPLLCRQMDYLLLRQLLRLDEKAIYALTLHRFARRLSRKIQFLSDRPGEQEKSINRPGLPYDYQRLCFLSGRNTRVCPLCLDEKNGYDRLYWRCTLILYCPRVSHLRFVQSAKLEITAQVSTLFLRRMNGLSQAIEGSYVTLALTRQKQVRHSNRVKK